MGINPKIGITGLPRSGKSAVLRKVIDMLVEERKNGVTRGTFSAENLIGGMTTESIIENGILDGNLKLVSADTFKTLLMLVWWLCRKLVNPQLQSFLN